jgi:beta-lactamase class A
MLFISKETLIKFSLPCFISLAIGLIIGVFIPVYFNPKDFSFEKIHEVRNSQNYKYINPLLECESANISQDKNLTTLKTQIKNFIDDQTKNNKDISFGSVYYRDLNNGPWIGIHQDELFSPASLIKVPLMMAYYQIAQEDSTILQKKLLNTQTFDSKDQNIQPEVYLQPNQEYTVDDLINRMIIYSDNLAYNLLLSNIDNQKIYQVYSDLGVDISKAKDNPDGNILTVAQYASFYRILFNSSYLDKDMSEKALSLLSQTKYNQALVAGVPDNIQVSHKFGERQYTQTGEKQLHDCGIVYLPKKPYLLCVMTRGDNFDNEANFIKQISQMVYKDISSR